MSPLIDIPDTYLHWCSNVQVICLAPLCIRTLIRYLIQATVKRLFESSNWEACYTTCFDKCARPRLCSVWRDPKSERYRFRDFFSVPNFFETDSETFFRYQNSSRPIPRLFFGTHFFRDRFRDFFRYQIFFETGSDTIKKLQKSRERDETGTQINTNILKNFETGSNIFFRYQKFSRPVPRLFFGTKNFWFRFRDFFWY